MDAEEDHENFARNTGILNGLFINELNSLYCAKSHLFERLTDISEQPNFIPLKNAIDTTLQELEQQIAVLNNVYDKLSLKYTFDNCGGLITLFEETFAAITENLHHRELCYMMMLFYLYHIESTENLSARLLMVIMQRSNNSEINQLLKKAMFVTESALIKELAGRYVNWANN